MSLQAGMSSGGVEVVYTPNFTSPLNDTEFEEEMARFNVTNITESFVYKMRKDVKLLIINRLVKVVLTM